MRSKQRVAFQYHVSKCTFPCNMYLGSCIAALFRDGSLHEWLARLPRGFNFIKTSLVNGSEAVPNLLSTQRQKLSIAEAAEAGDAAECTLSRGFAAGIGIGRTRFDVGNRRE